MNRRTYGILAGIIGSAVGAWLYRNRLMRRLPANGARPRERGEVIFDNTPTVAETDAF